MSEAMTRKMTDEECAILHNLLAKYCTQYAAPGEWSVSERRAFSELANDLEQSITDSRLLLVKFPEIV